MKHKNLKKRLLALATTVMTLAMCMVTAMPAMAANQSVKGGTTTFDKYLVMDQEANVPNVTFGFTIAAGEAVVATDSTPAIYKGIGTPTVGTAIFTSDDSKNTVAGKPSDVAGSPTDGFKYVTKEVTVNFSNVSFSAPGIYRYIITETAPTQDGITIEGHNTRTLDVYVEYAENSDTALAVTHYVLHDDTGNPNTATKSDGFTNTYATSNLTLEKQVTGNQGDRDKYFEFTVNITDAVAGTVYSVDLTDATWSSTSSPNPTELTVGESGAVSGTFYLKDDESIVIQGLTEDTSYTIAETSYANDGYKTEYKIDSEASVEANTTTAKIMGTSDHKVIFTNDKSGTVPTGILLETAPYVVLMLVVVAGGVALLAAKRKHSR